MIYKRAYVFAKFLAIYLIAIKVYWQIIWLMGIIRSMGKAADRMGNILKAILGINQKEETFVPKAGAIREHFVFTGRVQGVGFRFRAGNLATHYGVTGWIRNNVDGTVEAEMQGREEELDKIIQALQHDSYIRIDWMERERMEPEPQERKFSVRY